MNAMKFSDEEKATLKGLAREAIECVLLGKDKCAVELPDILKKKMGAFVTLKCKGDLRGCIGHLRGVLPLSQTVEEMAVQAAFHDPRFDPISKEDWNNIDLEISVLSPMRKITDVNEIEVGVHGIYIEKGFNSGLLLPQVAVENRWDRMTFLEYTCYKAGLPMDAWKSKDATIYIFSAEVF
jgi:AmmeMemoRadiSam system protein A